MLASTEESRKTAAITEKSQTTKKDLDIEEEPGGELNIDDPGADEDVEINADTEPAAEAPHSYHAAHDMHDFYGAGVDAYGNHLKLADNEKFRALAEDHAAQLQAMADELRAFCEEEHPDHPAPEPLGMEEKSETEEEPHVEPGLEDEIEQKSHTRRGRKSEDEEEDEERTEKSITPQAYRALERKVQRLAALMEEEFADA